MGGTTTSDIVLVTQRSDFPLSFSRNSLAFSGNSLTFSRNSLTLRRKCKEFLIFCKGKSQKSLEKSAKMVGKITQVVQSMILPSLLTTFSPKVSPF